jgi:hypothetical protein
MELTRGLKFRLNAVVANEVVKKSGVYKVESRKTFDSFLHEAFLAR